MKKLLFIILLLPFISTAQFKRSITLDQPASDLTDFPVLFSGTYTYLKTVANGGKVVNANGYDIVFYSDAGLTTMLKFERVTWDASTGTCEFWIKIPTLTSASATVIYLAYGNSAIVSDQQDAVNVWTNSYQGVWHLPDGTTLTANDSKGVNNGTLVNTPTATAGKIDGAANIVRASNQYIDVGNDASLQITGNLTIECWVNFTTNTLTHELVAKDNNTGGRAYNLDHFAAAGNFNFRFYINGGAGSNVIVSTNTISTGAWYHIVGVYNTSGTLDIYFNGVSDATQVTGAATSIPSATANVWIGRRQFAGSEDNFNGKMDEVRISNVSRSAVYIATSYSNQNDPVNFYSIGAELNTSRRSAIIN